MRVLLSSTHPMRSIRSAVAGGSAGGVQRLLTPPGWPGDLQLQVGDGAGDAIERRHQIGETLARLHGADGEDVRRRRSSRGRRRRQQRQPVVDDVHPAASTRKWSTPRLPSPGRPYGRTRRGLGRVGSVRDSAATLGCRARGSAPASGRARSRAAPRCVKGGRRSWCRAPRPPAPSTLDRRMLERAHARSKAAAGIGIARPARTVGAARPAAIARPSR